jgi:hypothetical protein
VTTTNTADGDDGPAGDLTALMDALDCDADRASRVLAALSQPRNGRRLLITYAEYGRLERIANAAEAYRAEVECPAPDLLERARLRTALFATLGDTPDGQGRCAQEQKVAWLAKWLEAETWAVLSRAAVMYDDPRQRAEAEAAFARSARDLLYALETNLDEVPLMYVPLDAPPPPVRRP